MDEDWRWPGVSIGWALVCAVSAYLWVRAAQAAPWPVLAAAAVYLSMLLALLLADPDSDGLWLQVADNLVLLGLGIWLVVRGIGARVSHFFYSGVLTILLTGLLRYIDLVGNYVGSALLFALFAVLLLGAARFWKASHAGGER